MNLHTVFKYNVFKYCPALEMKYSLQISEKKSDKFWYQSD